MTALVVLTSACDWMYCRDREDVSLRDPPTVKALDVIPPTAYVIPGATFVLRARMLDEANGVLLSHPQLSWTPGAGLSQQAVGADSIVLKAGAVSPGTNTGVTAQVGPEGEGLVSSATLLVIPANAPGSADVVFADARPVGPDAVFVDGRTATGSVNDSLVAFVASGILGSFSGDGEVVRLATDRRFLLWTGDLRAGRKEVDLRSAGGPSAQTTVRPTITVWDATSLGVAADVLDDVQYARAVLTRERTGIAFDYALHIAPMAGLYTLDLGVNFSCHRLGEKLEAVGIPVQSLSADRLTVIYFDDILKPQDDRDPVSAGLRGYACPHETTFGNVVLISDTLRSVTTLGHELGHAFGLLEPEWGHTKYLSGFSYTNMMWSYENDARTEARATFSLGQAFRINADNQSWLFQVGLPTWGPRDCAYDIAVSIPCPALARDFVPLPE